MSISFSNLSVRQGAAEIIRGISGELPKGALTALVGPNGAGKTTLLRALLGLVPAEGEITIDHQPLAGLSRAGRARLMAYLPQKREAAWPVLVRDIVALGLPTKLPHEERTIEAALDETCVSHLAKRAIDTLSGGEEARVHLARALVGRTPYLLADEPVASLDPRHQLDVLRLLKGRAEGGAGVVAVLHDLTLADAFADRIILLHHGRVAGAGCPDDVLSADALAGIYGVAARRVGGRLVITGPAS
jgi:iron complex transport system ATP-binding protein